MKPAMYIFVNRGLGMSPGKIAAQAGHAAVEAFRVSDPKLIEQWDLGKHYAKLVMLAEDTEQIQAITLYLTERGFKAKLIIDEGHTEIRPFSFTALGVEIVDRDDPHTQATFGEFRTYKPKKQSKPQKKWWHYIGDPTLFLRP